MKNLLVKTYFFLFLAIFCAYQAQACQLSIPESYVPTFLNPPVSGHYTKCEDKPEEACHCVDDVDPYASVLIDEVDDLGIYTGKKLLRHSPVKQLAKEAKIAADKAAEIEKHNKKKADKLAIKEDIKTATTVAKLKAVIEKMIEAQE